MDQLKHTPLINEHRELGGKIIDFGGWALPVNYGSQIEEHHSVRQNVGIFDVSHMTVTDLTGKDARSFLQTLLANDIAKTDGKPGKAIYSCMLNEKGGVIDDLIVYHIDETFYRVVSNAGTRDTVNQWLNKQAKSFEVEVAMRPELALMAVQGPEAMSLCQRSLQDAQSAELLALSRFEGKFIEPYFVGRTGYTGEDGFEFIGPENEIIALWRQLIKNGAQPCGLGARDTLRLESGMALYGNDLDADHTPLESGVSWCVSFSEGRDFIGKSALEQAPPRYRQIGLVLEDKGVLRAHQTLEIKGEPVGEITSGTFSPTLQRSIGMARINAGISNEEMQQITVNMRGKNLAIKIVKPPFVKQGQSNF